MRITHVFKSSSNNAKSMIYDYNHAHGDIFSRYNRPSNNKIRAWSDILVDYTFNDCQYIDINNREIKCKTVLIQGKKHHIKYNGDIAIVGASSHFFSTIASFDDIETGQTWLIKETHCNTYACLYEDIID